MDGRWHYVDEIKCYVFKFLVLFSFIIRVFNLKIFSENFDLIVCPFDLIVCPVLRSGPRTDRQSICPKPEGQGQIGKGVEEQNTDQWQKGLESKTPKIRTHAQNLYVMLLVLRGLLIIC